MESQDIFNRIEKHLRKKNKTWTEVQIRENAKQILADYMEQNKEKIQKDKEEWSKQFDKAVDWELMKLSFGWDD
jgi:DNA-directed RNA polymerase specialized sigma subunit